jgi:tyrosinase
MRQRKNILNLAGGEADAFRKAVQALQDLSDPNRNYTHFANIHMVSCIHGCELFLPWHRAYILDYEDALRQVSGSQVTLPYWDWIGTPAIPDLFTTPALLHPRAPNDPNFPLPTADEIQNALHITEFFRFGGTHRRPGIPPTPGQIDNLHGMVHLWVGGDMADVTTFKSAFDPIFWSHHSNVDRLWAQWQRDFGNDGPTDTTTILRGLDTQRNAGSVLDIGPNGLAYEYVEDVFDHSFEGGVIGPTARVKFDLRRVKSDFTRAEIRLLGLREVKGNPLPSAIAVALPGMQTPAQVSLFGLHPMHGQMHDHSRGAAMMEHANAMSPILDVTRSVPRAKSRMEAEIELRLVAGRGIPKDTCRIGIERIQFVLFTK